PQILARWFTPSNLIYFAPVPLLVLVATWLQLRLLQKRDPGAGPFACDDHLHDGEPLPSFLSSTGSAYGESTFRLLE
ncbi:hypothetical protein ACC676_39850, partial [Rhizobium ruizarguesonis]